MPGESPALSPRDYLALGEFRYRIRHFLRFSELATRQEGLEPQQHQFLLAVRTLDEPDGPTVRQIADYLLVRHNSAVGLIDRLVEHGLVQRARGRDDRRQVRVKLTAKGEEILKRLSLIHRDELRNSGPRLVNALGELLRSLPPEAEARP
ncbi:MAG: MarR family transcriptional regulator [Acidobacteriia bacterium]|nr:MarR family transcriptional regulator [Terriglobia bacterium]